MDKKPLDGIRILDLTQFLSGPYCTMILADLGAEVIKVERPPVGDGTRVAKEFPGTSNYFVSCNRGKKSIVMDLKNPTHHEIFKELVKKSDLVIENYKPGTMDKMGLGYTTLCELKPDLIYVAISGYGQTGPYRNLGALDVAIQAMSGLMSITGPRGGEPTKTGPSIADISAGIYAAIASLAAIRYHDQTGKGQYVDISMLDTTVSLLENVICTYFSDGVVPKSLGNHHRLAVPFGAFKAKDGYAIICCANDGHYNALSEALGHPEWPQDPHFVNIVARLANRDLCVSTLEAALADYTREEIAMLLTKAGVPCASIQTIDQVVTNPQVLARKMIVEINEKNAGTFKTAGFPINMSEMERTTSYSVPTFGENTYEILSDVLGMDAEALKPEFEPLIEEFYKKIAVASGRDKQ